MVVDMVMGMVNVVEDVVVDMVVVAVDTLEVDITAAAVVEGDIMIAYMFIRGIDGVCIWASSRRERMASTWSQEEDDIAKLVSLVDPAAILCAAGKRNIEDDWREQD
ncbi:hypothetical protein EJB05_52632, partial [Eragrostis curvula]